MDWYTETPRGWIKLGNPDSPNEIDENAGTIDDFDCGQGDLDSMMGCFGDD